MSNLVKRAAKRFNDSSGDPDNIEALRTLIGELQGELAAATERQLAADAELVAAKAEVRNTRIEQLNDLERVQERELTGAQREVLLSMAANQFAAVMRFALREPMLQTFENSSLVQQARVKRH